MNPRLYPYFFRQAFINIRNNRMVHFLGMGTMVVSLLIFGTFLLLFVNVNSWVHGWGHSLSMAVYLKDGIDKNMTDRIASRIKSFPAARIARYISKTDALNSLRAALGPESGLLEGLSRNPLPASFEVVFENIEFSETDPYKIKKAIEKIDGVDEVQYSEEWLRRFEGLMNVIRLAGFIIGGLLGIGVLFIVTNTIKLTIYSRKYEIEIQKLVGATDWFVKMPFLLEGLIQGLSGGVIALLMLFLGYFLLSAKQVQFFGLAVLNFNFLPRRYVFSILLVSILLGLAGSLIAVGRFLSTERFDDV